MPVSRSAGVDVHAGTGLEAALQGADAVIDALNISASDQAEIVDFFAATTRNLLAAGERAGVRHHVLLSMAGEVLLPGPGARLTSTTFADWLAAGAH